MHCQSCGGLLPQDAHACPHCGTLTPAYYAAAEDDQAQTLPSTGGKGLAAASSGTPYDRPAPAVATPNTGYGSNPYGQTANPYGTNVPPPPPGGKKSRRNLTVVAVLVLVILGAGVLVLAPLLQQSAGNTNGNRSTAPQVTSAPLSVQQAQTLYDQTVSNSPVLNDPLSSPDNFGWDNKTLANTSCAFTGGAYHSKAVPGYFSPCYASATNYSNFIFQAEMTIIAGHSGGLVFRADKTNDQSYLFRVSTDGTYILNKYTLGSDKQLKADTLISGQSTLLKTGAKVANQLAALLHGDDIYLFINKKYVAMAHDDQYRSGAIGVYTDSDAGSVEAIFRNAQVWQLD